MKIKIKKYIKKNSIKKLKTIRKDILESLNFGLKSIDPINLLNNFIDEKRNILKIDSKYIKLENFKNIYLISTGKAAIKMGISIINKLKIKEGLIVSNEKINNLEKKIIHIIKENHNNGIFNIKLIKENIKKINYINGGHPLPDENSVIAGNNILKIINKLEEDDLLIFLLSGGSSSITEVPLIPLDILKKLTIDLLKSGADIYELNTIRKHLSKLKGGKLLKIAKSTIISFILSDVPGDNLQIIGSGPTYFDNSNLINAYSILKKYNLDKKYKEVYLFFNNKINNENFETLKEEEYNILVSQNKLYNILIASNSYCCYNISEYLLNKNYNIIQINEPLSGNVKKISNLILNILYYLINNKIENNNNIFLNFYGKILEKNIKTDFPIAIIWGGELTVKIKGKSGIGGRNQHFVLSFLNNIIKSRNIKYLDLLYIPSFKFNKKNNKNNESNLYEKYLFCIVSFGTDGIDGVSKAAGAIADNWTLSYIYKNKIKIEKYINSFDSFNFFNKINDSIITGPTGTNVADVGILIIDKFLL
ncbi:MAG: DUF4147 domain-containing protein [Spirochaetes bacterium]|nr:DUF4147 domain-containing protein [Spirochaetota bacterium]